MQELVKALVKARSEFQPIVKDKKNSHFQNSYASLDAVLEAVTPALTANGLAVVQTTDLMSDRFVLVSRLLHESGQEILSTYPLPTNGKPQEIGSALTYARRYALCALLNVAADEDDDAEAATPKNKPQGNTISESQITRMMAIANSKNVPDTALKAIVNGHGFKSRKEITKDMYEQICSEIQNYSEVTA